MTSSSTLGGVWKALELEPDQASGVYERRVFALSGFAVFAGLVRPGLQLRFGFDVPASISTDGLERETKGFRVRRYYRATNYTTRVSLELDNTSFRELFEVMSEDIAGRILAASDERAAVAAMRDRLNHWERFMSASGPGGLSREQQIGLYGELTFLKAMLQAGVSGSTAVTWWCGQTSENQDFQAGNRAVEVKATTGNSATAAWISNELQLDDSDCQSLYLLHLWLKELGGAGTSLPDLVDELSAMLAGVAAVEFADRLGIAGYHDIHRSLYDDTGYLERARRYFIVRDDFPRIRRADLPPGVSRVKYQIDVAGFEGFQRPEGEAIASLTSAPL